MSNEFPPHHVFDAEENRWNGAAIDIFRLLAKNIECDINIVNVPWERTIDLLARGRIDALSMFTYSDQRADFSYFIGPHYRESIVFIVNRKLEDSVLAPGDLVNFKGLIGKTKGSYYGEQLDGLLKQDNVKTKLVDIVSNQNRIDMLKAGRLDAIIEEHSVANYLFNSKALNKDEFVVKLKFSLSPVFFGFSKHTTTEQRLERLQLAWQQLLETHQINDIYAKYNLDFSDDMLIKD